MSGDARETLKDNPKACVNRTLAAGTIIKIAGIPFRLEIDTTVSGHPENFALAAEMAMFPELRSPLKAVTHSAA